MNYYSLPIDVKDIDNICFDDSCVDMSRLRFPVPPEKQVRSAFLFLRNTNLSLPLDFSKCTFERKCEYLINYFKGNISIKIPELLDTWVEILMIRSSQLEWECDSNIEHQPLRCNFFNDWQETSLFIYDNEEFIDEVLKIIISLPLCSIQCFLSDKENVKTDISMEEFPKSSWNGLNMNNFIHLIDNEVIVHLIKPVGQLRPTFYTKYFFTEGNPYMDRMLTALPFLGLLNAMMYNTGDGSFANTLNEALNKEVSKNND